MGVGTLMHVALTLPNSVRTNQAQSWADTEYSSTFRSDSNLFGPDALNTSFSNTGLSLAEMTQHNTSTTLSAPDPLELSAVSFNPELRALAEAAALEQLNQDFMNLSFSIGDFARSAPGADVAPAPSRPQRDDALGMLEEDADLAVLTLNDQRFSLAA